MRLPNSYGSVYKLKGKRRNPWVARKTLGWKDGNNGEPQPVYKYIGYFPSRSDALDALAEYNRNPLGFPDTITLGVLYNKWSEKHYEKIKPNTINQFKYAWKIIEPYKDKELSFFTLAVWQEIFDSSGKNAPSLKSVKVILSLMYKFAEQYDLIDPRLNKIEFIDIGTSNPNKIERKAFTKDEIETLWKNKETFKHLLILIYTGLRVGEYISLTPEDVHLEERWIDVRESKTKAGIRQVPIAEKIVPFLTELVRNEKYLCPTVTGLKYSNTHFNETEVRKKCSKYGMDHASHDARHTCITLLTEARIDPRVIMQIVGHAGAGVTQQVYTHISMDAKLDAINRI